jgi:hypothetical protein
MQSKGRLHRAGKIEVTKRIDGIARTSPHEATTAE